MKLGQLRQLFAAAEDLYRESGNVAVAQSLRQLSTSLDGHEAMTVSSFLKKLASLDSATGNLQ